MTDDSTSPRALLKSAVTSQTDGLISATQTLVQAASPNPPGDTSAVAGAVTSLLKTAIPDIEISRYEPSAGIVNVVARVDSGKPGPRLVLNGHLDTYPLLEDLGWSFGPLSGALVQQQPREHDDGGKGSSSTTSTPSSTSTGGASRIYGRGVSDMKGGIAASITAADILAQHKALWAGEIVLTFAGDEETMGNLGARWLITHDPRAIGDAVICGDAGSPRVVRFGEKGFVWVAIEAEGVAAHGAHVHKGVNAINRLRRALDAVQSLEGDSDVQDKPPAEVSDAIDRASEVSESLSGAGESHTLRNVTVNIGTIAGGESLNLMPSHARAECDIRLPFGVTTDRVIRKIEELLEPLEGVTCKFMRAIDPSYTFPAHDIVRHGLAASTEVTGTEAVPNMRVGASDMRVYRAAGVPSVVVGCTPNNMGGADEYVEVDELVRIAQIHTLMAYDYLRGT